MPTRHRRSRGPLLMILAAALLGCGDTPGATDARPDGTPATDAAIDGGPDGANLRDAGDVPLFDAGPSPCEAPDYFSPLASRISFLHLPDLAHGDPFVGLDVDNNPSTCSPAGVCNAGMDNQLVTLSVEGCFSQPINAYGFNYLTDQLLATADPPANWLFEASGLTLVGDDSAAPFSVVMHQGHWYWTEECEEATHVLDPNLRCDYISDGDMFAWGSCEPLSVLPNAEIIDGRLVAGGPSQTLSMIFAAQGLTAGMVLHHVQMEANVTVVGDELTLTDGLLAGVVCPQEMVYILSAIVNVDPNTPECMMATKLPLPDLEVGCSADEPDGISVGLQFNAYPAHIVGLLRN